MFIAGISSIFFVGFFIFELFYGLEGFVYGFILSFSGIILVFNIAGVVIFFYFSSG